MRRRQMLTGTAGAAAGLVLGSATGVRADRIGDPAGGLESLLYGDLAAAPVPLPALGAATERMRSDFQTARYGRLAAGLPRLLAQATATRDHADLSDREQASGLLADMYVTATNYCVKLNDDLLAATTADRALQAARASGDPLLLADARRALATVMRRTGHPQHAHELLLATAHSIEPGAHPTPDELSVYGNVLVVAAYTAAVDGNRHLAADLIGEAGRTARRLGADANHRHTAFGPTNVALYKVSIAQVLGDAGRAIDHAKALRPGAIPTAERQGRYWIDVARAWHQWGKPTQCYRALLAAERAAPAEVRYRPPVHRITEALLRADGRSSLPGLRDFARRVGVLS